MDRTTSLFTAREYPILVKGLNGLGTLGSKLKLGVGAKLRAKEQKSVLKLKRISPILVSHSQNKEKSDEGDRNQSHTQIQDTRI